jgi:hypothetical protein
MCLFSHTLELVKYGAELTELINYTFPTGNNEYVVINGFCMLIFIGNSSRLIACVLKWERSISEQIKYKTHQ